MVIRDALAAVAAAGLLALAGCASADHGTVTDKGYDEAYTDSIAVGDVDVPMDHDECWHLYFTDENGSDGDTCLSEQDWNSYAVGDTYPKATP
jgi:hypothetical protein